MSSFRKKSRHVSPSINRRRGLSGAPTILSETMRIDARDGRSDSCYQRSPKQQRKKIGSEWSLPFQGLSTRKRSALPIPISSPDRKVITDA